MYDVCMQHVIIKASQTSIHHNEVRDKCLDELKAYIVVVRPIFSQYLSIKHFSSIRFVVQRIQQSDVHTMQIHALLRFEFCM